MNLSFKSAYKLAVVFLILNSCGYIVSAAQQGIIKTDSGPKKWPTGEAPRFTLGVNSSYRAILGRFDAYGDYTETPSGNSTDIISTTFSESFRFTDNWEQSFSLGLNHISMITTTGSSDSYSLGSPNINIKYHFHQLSHLSVEFGGGIPLRVKWGTGSGDPSQSSVLAGDMGGSGGRGPDLHVGFSLWQMVVKALKATFQTQVSRPFGQTVNQSDVPDASPVYVERAMTYQLGEGLSYLFAKAWDLHLGFRQSWAGNSISDGQVMEGTASRLFTTSLGVSYTLNSSWRISSSYQTPYPFYDYIVNQPYAPSISIGAVYTGL